MSTTGKKKPVKGKGNFGTFLRKAGKWTLRLLLFFFIGTFLLVLTYRFVNPPLTWLMFQRWAFEGHGLSKDWVDIEEVPYYVPLAMLTSEDQKFMQHNGFDYEAIEKAMKFNEKKKGKKIKGGSTISQQTAKNVFCWPQRSWVRKGFETYFTFLIEMLWPKKRIIEVYINVVEFGPGVYGVEAAAQKFWNIPSSRLSRYQACLLSAVLPRPLKYNAGKPGPYVRRRANWTMKHLNMFPGNYLDSSN